MERTDKHIIAEQVGEALPSDNTISEGNAVDECGGTDEVACLDEAKPETRVERIVDNDKKISHVLGSYGLATGIIAAMEPAVKVMRALDAVSGITSGIQALTRAESMASSIGAISAKAVPNNAISAVGLSAAQMHAGNTWIDHISRNNVVNNYTATLGSIAAGAAKVNVGGSWIDHISRNNVINKYTSTLGSIAAGAAKMNAGTSWIDRISRNEVVNNRTAALCSAATSVARATAGYSIIESLYSKDATRYSFLGATYSGLDYHSLAHSAVHAAIPKSVVGIGSMMAASVASDSYRRTGAVIDHIYPKNLFDDSRVKLYSGQDLIPSSWNDISRSIDQGYDNYVIEKKRDKYKSLLDRYYLETDVLQEHRTAMVPGVNWYDLITEKISGFVNSLDQYIVTKDSALLFDLHNLEWEAMAVGYSAGYSASLEAFYGSISSSTARNKYARRKYNAIIRQKNKIKHKLNLRIVFRNIIRFLFKNMDDESGDSNVANNQVNNICITDKIIHNEQFRHIYTFKHAA